MENGASTMLILAGGIIVAIAIIAFAKTLKTEVEKAGAKVSSLIEDALAGGSTTPPGK